MYDIVVGIPSYNESDSIQQVVRVVDRGLSNLTSYKSIIVNSDSQSEDKTAEIFLSTNTLCSKVSLDGGKTPRGKGTNILNIMRFAQHQRARCILLFDADVVSIEDSWVTKFAEEILNHGTDFVTPIYQRNPIEGNTTNHLMYPFIFAVLGCDIRQPIAGDVGLSGRFCDSLLDCKYWESTLQYGIDIFITAYAIINGFSLQQIQLTRKVHKPSFPKMMKIASNELDTLFRILVSRNKVIETNLKINSHTVSSIDENRIFPTTDLVALTKERIREYININKEEIITYIPILQQEFYEKPEMQEELCISKDTWVNVLAHVFSVLNAENIEGVTKVLTNLYMCRVFGFWNEIKGLTSTQIEQEVFQQAINLRHTLLALMLEV